MGLNFGDEAITAPAHGFDVACFLAVLAECFARVTDAPRNRNCIELLAAPQRINELSLRYESIAMFDEIPQRIEYARLERHAFALASQLARCDIQLERTKRENHSLRPTL